MNKCLFYFPCKYFCIYTVQHCMLLFITSYTILLGLFHNLKISVQHEINNTKNTMLFIRQNFDVKYNLKCFLLLGNFLWRASSNAFLDIIFTIFYRVNVFFKVNVSWLSRWVKSGSNRKIYSEMPIFTKKCTYFLLYIA
jgi:hypothetical protein